MGSSISEVWVGLKCILPGLMNETVFLASFPLLLLIYCDPPPLPPKFCKDEGVRGNTCFIEKLHLALEIPRNILHCWLKPGSCTNNK